MTKCEKCNLKIMDNSQTCPLCKQKTIRINEEEEKLYPTIANIRRVNVAIKILLWVSAIVSILCIFINLLVNHQVSWSGICVGGILYTWIIVLYSIYRNLNIASHVMLQTICVSILTVLIDAFLGFQKWSINYAIPIVLTLANVTLFVLLLVNRKRYFKYSIYHIFVFLLSFVPVLFLGLHWMDQVLPVVISVGISVVVAIFSIIFCNKDIRAELDRRFDL